MQPHDLWQLFNLRDTPYFQEALRPGEGARYPVEWFVGRDAEAERLSRTILGHAGSSRQSIRGSAGVGKSTLAQRVKALLAPQRLYSTPDAVALGHADGADEVCVRILSYVYETLLAAAQERGVLVELEKSEAVQNTRQLVRVFREATGLSGGISLSVLGGVSAGRSASLNNPSTAKPSILVVQLLQGLMRVAREELNARGILVHVNNLENLSDADAKRAGAIFRDLRDPCLLADGYHWLVVGTGEALSAAIDTHPQLRSVFSLTLALDPLKPSELLQLLERRYRALAMDASKSVRPPILPRAVQGLYTLFHGDLRGTLAALDEAAHGLLGYGKKPDSSLTLPEIQPFLQHRYEADARARLTGAQLKSLTALAQRVKNASFLIKDAASIWKNERSRATRLVAELQRAGYVLPLERVAAEERGRPAGSYGLSGSARLAFPG
jgi:predicted kinase